MERGRAGRQAQGRARRARIRDRAAARAECRTTIGALPRIRARARRPLRDGGRFRHSCAALGDGRAKFSCASFDDDANSDSRGLAEKTAIERENKWLSARDMPTSQMQLCEIRQSWEHLANEHLARAGLDIRIDHRSHQERGLDIEPTEHMGVHATQMERRGKEVSRTRLDSEAARRNAELIREKPEQVLSIITNEKSVFDRRDIARALHRYIDQPEAFQSAFATVMAAPSVVELQAERRGAQGRVLEPARYSTQDMVEIERGMIVSASRLATSGLGEARDHGAGERNVEAALSAWPFLSDEQREAVRHVTGEGLTAAVVGLAGAGR